MELRQLGRTGIRVPVICLGTMTFGGQIEETSSFAIMDKAFAAGATFWDTADGYPLGGTQHTRGRTEEIMGRWLRDRGVRDQVFLATKCAVPMGATVNDAGLSRYNIQRSVEGSLKRLKTDVIDLYQGHFFDPHTPIDETLRALDDLVKAGKVRYIGASNYPAWRFADALATSERLNLARFECLQPRYNLLYRDIETEVMPLCRDKRIGIIAYNPIAGGLLSGKYRAGEVPQEGTRFTQGAAGPIYQARYWDDLQLAAVEDLSKAVSACGYALASVAVAWVLDQPGITSAIVGASRPEQLDATLQGADLKLDDELKALCDAVWWNLPRKPVVDGYR